MIKPTYNKFQWNTPLVVARWWLVFLLQYPGKCFTLSVWQTMCSKIRLGLNDWSDFRAGSWFWKRTSYQSIAWDHASLSVCQTSFHCEVVSVHTPLPSAWGRRSCGAAPSLRLPVLSPHCHPPVGTCLGNEVPSPGTPAGRWGGVYTNN